MNYNERLQDLATEMANSIPEWERTAMKFDITKDEFIKPFYTYAAIALKHMAEAYAEGHEHGTVYPHIDINLQSLGLIEPQTT